jgi:hypothetical protein
MPMNKIPVRTEILRNKERTPVGQQPDRINEKSKTTRIIPHILRVVKGGIKIFNNEVQIPAGVPGFDEWIRERKKGIGGSDAASILGMNPYKTNVDLWK